jgi:predicted kinase
LIVIRGNSASGKSTIAAAIRGKYGRGLAVVSQDNIRRVVLREHDRPGGANIGLLGLTCRYAIGAGFCTVLEGILCSAHYGQMLAGLRAEYGDRSSWWYVDVPFEQTLQRHATKPQVSVYGRAEMSAWWHEHDLLPRGGSSRSSRPPRQPRPPLTRSCAMPG